jgi:hypothetical protein
MNMFVVIAVLIFVLGVWIGIGAPGWPHKPEGRRRHTQQRSLNPIAWGRTPGRERQKPRSASERRVRLR